MSRFRLSRQLLVAVGVCALLLGAAVVQAQQYDDPQAYDQSQAYDNADQAPGRVARLAYLSGQVQFAPAGESDWGSVEVNRPMVIGDRLLTGDDGRAVLELGDASIRVDNDSAFDFLNLDQDNVQVELSQGTLNLAVRELAQDANFEVDTPTVAFVASTPGIYRIDDNPDGTGSMVTVFQGSGTVYGENGASRQVAAGTSYRFNDSTLASVEPTGLPQADDFDRFCEARDANYNRYAQQAQQYVPPDMIGGDDLDQYGQWNDVPEYGNVWYPSSVPAGWAPYRYGHWAWIDPWGWTWVGDEPWGFAPFHYGRWVYVRNRWGWMPGPVHVRPVYAPALVAFIGGSGLSLSINTGGGGPVGWFPLGPRDVYTPWFHASRNYFTNVNVTNIRNVYVNRTTINNFYNNYHAGRVPPRGGHDYAYRRMPGAVTAVPRNVFTGARPVHTAALKLNRTQLVRSEVALRPGVNPGRNSLGLRHPTARPTAIKGREPFARPVVARHQPPPRPVDFATRQKVIANQHGQPLTSKQMQDLRKARPTQNHDRVKLVPVAAGAATGAAAIGALRHGTTPPRPAEPAARTQPARPVAAPRAGEPPARRTGPTTPFKNTVHPIQAPVNPVRNAPQRPNELPSARFAHPREPATLPRAPVIRPAGEPQRNPSSASGRLPVVRPIERAPQRTDNQAAQQQRQAAVEVQQRAHAQQLQQQRQAQAQAQQRVREQQAQQQRQAQEQHRARQQQAQRQQQQRAREQQMQQQRQAQMQEQRAQQQRAMQAQQQQRNMQMQRQQQVRQREVQRAPQSRGRPAPQRREPPPGKRPPPSSDHPIR